LIWIGHGEVLGGEKKEWRGVEDGVDRTVERTERYMREEFIVETLSAEKGGSFVDVVWFGGVELRVESLCTCFVLYFVDTLPVL